MMKLGLAIPKYYEAEQADPYRKTFELAQLAEEAGFGFISVPHHSFTPDTEDYAAPFMMMAALAARTSTIRIASTIFIMPLYPPVAIAEALAELDRLSGGRIIFGTAVGYRDYEFAGHGVDIHSRGQRMDEMLTVIQGAFQTGYVEFSGRHFDIPRSTMAPLPIQTPGPPIWIGGHSDAALRRAGRFGDGWLSENLYMLEGMKERIGTLHGFCAEAGRKPADVIVIRNANLSDDRAQVEREWLPEMIEYHLFNRENYRRAGIVMPDPDGVYARLEAGKRVGFKEFCQQRVIAGSPDDCVEQLRLWESETGARHVHLVTKPYLTNDREFEAQKRMIRLFGQAVIPFV